MRRTMSVKDNWKEGGLEVSQVDTPGPHLAQPQLLPGVVQHVPVRLARDGALVERHDVLGEGERVRG